MKSCIRKSASHIELQLEANGMTYLLDVTRKIRTFQNPEETSWQIIDYIMSDYQNSIYRSNIAAEPIGQFLFQYEETDWEFLKRVVNRYRSGVYPNALSDQISFQAGLSSAAPELQAEESFFVSRYRFNDYELYKENGEEPILQQQYISYEIETYKIMPLGACLTYKTEDWHISGIRRELKAGLLVNTYVLSRKQADARLRYFNKMLPGISLDGVAADVSRDKVRVMIKNDLNTVNCGQYWFPYSTVAGSSDGSGWYCMPEKGEPVRVYFPTDDESEGYVISNLSGKTGSGKESMDPAVRRIETAQGNVVSFSEEGADISVKNGAAGISLGKSGDISITGADSISFYAGGKVFMDADSISMESEIKADLINDAGSNLTVQSGRIDIAAVKIYEN